MTRMPLDSSRTRTQNRVSVTDQAVALIQNLQKEHGDLIFHQSGGCCDGSAPMCLARDEFYLDDSDVLLGEIAGCPFYMNREQFEYWKHTFLMIDVVEGRGASFSLEIPHGVRFITKSRLLNAND